MNGLKMARLKAMSLEVMRQKGVALVLAMAIANLFHGVEKLRYFDFTQAIHAALPTKRSLKSQQEHGEVYFALFYADLNDPDADSQVQKIVPTCVVKAGCSKNSEDRLAQISSQCSMPSGGVHSWPAPLSALRVEGE